MPTIETIPITHIRFPEIRLKTRDAHKLRGYFGNLFKTHSTLLHNHYEDGSYRYRYPLVQYKVIKNVPTLVGIGEGAELLPQLFLKIKELEIEGQIYPIHAKNIVVHQEESGFSTDLHTYSFDTLWMALNQNNYSQYHELEQQQEKNAMLNRVLIGHILSFFKNMDIRLKPEERIMTKVQVKEKSTLFRGHRMLAFSGQFTTNALLPDGIGLGKSVSRGFGTIKKIKII